MWLKISNYRNNPIKRYRHLYREEACKLLLHCWLFLYQFSCVFYCRYSVEVNFDLDISASVVRLGRARESWQTLFCLYLLLLLLVIVYVWWEAELVLADEGGDHAVEEDEEADEMVSQLDHRLFQVRLQLTAVVNFCRGEPRAKEFIKFRWFIKTFLSIFILTLTQNTLKIGRNWINCPTRTRACEGASERTIEWLMSHY